jgi:hypothetical protein
MTPGMERLSQRTHCRGLNLFEVIAMMLIVGGLAYGFTSRIDHGLREGFLGALMGVGWGFAAYVIMMLAVLVPLWLFLQYRPYYPRCRTGKCRDRHYQVLSHDVAQEVQLLREGQLKPGTLVRCRCGTRYLLASREQRFYEVAEDGALVPYLRYRPYRRWEPDPG